MSGFSRVVAVDFIRAGLGLVQYFVIRHAQRACKIKEMYIDHLSYLNSDLLVPCRFFSSIISEIL